MKRKAWPAVAAAGPKKKAGLKSPAKSLRETTVWTRGAPWLRHDAGPRPRDKTRRLFPLPTRSSRVARIRYLLRSSVDSKHGRGGATGCPGGRALLQPR